MVAQFPVYTSTSQLSEEKLEFIGLSGPYARRGATSLHTTPGLTLSQGEVATGTVRDEVELFLWPWSQPGTFHVAIRSLRR